MTRYLVLSAFTTNLITHHKTKTELYTTHSSICQYERVFWLAGYETANTLHCWLWLLDSRMWNIQQTLLLLLFIGQQNVKQPTDIIVGAVYWSAGCETPNRLYCGCCLLDIRLWNNQQAVFLVLFTCQQDVKLLTDPIVGAIYWTAGWLYSWRCLLDSRMWNSQQTVLLVLFTGQHDLKQPTDCIVGAVYWTAGCETANRLYCLCCLLVSRMWTINRLCWWFCFLVSRMWTINTVYCWCYLLLLTNSMCCSDLNHLSVAHQITQNNNLLFAVICSWTHSEDYKQLTCSSTLNTATTSTVIANNWRRTDECYISLYMLCVI